jgi:hypothetical protein
MVLEDLVAAKRREVALAKSALPPARPRVPPR